MFALSILRRVHTLYLIALFLGVAALVPTSCKNEDNTLSSTHEPDVNPEVQIALAKYFEVKNGLLMGKKTHSEFQSTWSDQSKADALASRIEYCRDHLKTIEFGYTNYESTFDVTSVETSGQNTKVVCVEKYKLTTNDPDPDVPGKFIVTEGEDQYEIVFETSTGKWLVSSDICLDEDPYYVNLDVLNASRDVPDLGEESIVPRSYSYSASLAKAYAEQYWSNYNPAYANCNCCGGDCMNFCSQCLKAGHWTTNSSWNYGSTCTGSTSAWINSTSWKNYAINSGRIYSTNYADNALVVGDIMQVDFESNGSIDHSTIVTTRTVVNGIVKIYVTAHNTNQLNKISTYYPGTHYGRKVKLSAN
jgi:hypothetical protein